MNEPIVGALPEAVVRHCAKGRLRLKFREKIGQAAWFEEVKAALNKRGGFSGIDINPVTGSMLIQGESVDPSSLASWGQELNLFHLHYAPSARPLLAERASEPVAALNRQLKSITGGDLDLPTVIFIGLLINAFYQVARGRVGPLPWYSALWYAFGLFSKNLVR